MPIDIDELYKRWVEKIGEDKIVLKYPSLRGLWDWFLRETEAKGIDPETIDFEALVDPTLTYKENKAILDEELRAPLTEREYEAMSKEITAMMEKEAREKYPEIFDSLTDRIAELERETDRKKRYQKLVKELRLELAETIRKLEQERAKPPKVKPVSIRVLKDFREGIIDYKSGQVVETRDLEWALQKIEKGLAERLKPEVEEVLPPPVPEAPPEKEAKIKVKVEGGADKGEYIARMMFDSFEAGFVGFRTTDRLENWLRDGEEIVNWRENLRMAGFSPEEIEEELKTYPEPFRQGVDVRVFWKYPEDVSFDGVAQYYWNVWHTTYTRERLEPHTVEGLKDIAKIKGLRVPETKEELINVILGVRPPPPSIVFPPAPPPKPRELTAEEKRKLEDEFRVTLIRTLGKIPRDSMAEFRLELDAVKVLPYEKALDVILKLASEIIERETRPPPVRPPAPPPERIVRVGIPEEERPPPEVPAPPPEIPLPKTPLCQELPFPRAPCSAEKTVLFEAFKNRLEAAGVWDVRPYLHLFDERIARWPFRYWGEVLTLFDQLIEDIVARAKRFIPIPPMPWREEEEKRRRDAIVHFTATKLYDTMEDLIEALSTWGVFEVTPDEIKKALRNAYEKKELWLTSVSKEWLESLIGEKLES